MVYFMGITAGLIKILQDERQAIALELGRHVLIRMPQQGTDVIDLHTVHQHLTRAQQGLFGHSWLYILILYI